MLRVAAAAVVEEGRLLLVSKNAAPEVFYLPGGKPDEGESAVDCVHREVHEELGARVTSLEFLETVEATAALERVPMAMDVFLATLDRAPVAAAEIAAVAWYDDAAVFGGTLAPPISGGVIPSLRRRRML
jgi:ADP-ribose pyrophosphatase YjhB (NUDIX family)